MPGILYHIFFPYVSIITLTFVAIKWTVWLFFFPQVLSTRKQLSKLS